MARTRRELWETLNLDYFTELPTYRRLKRYLSYSAVFVAVGWVGWAGWTGDETLYSSGAMSVGHFSFGDDCMRCHIPGRGYWYLLEDEKALSLNRNCLICHGITIGHDPETETAWHQVTSSAPDGAAGFDPAGEMSLACSTCHSEHEGYRRLVDMSDRQCIQCHSDLTKAGGYESIGYYGNISTFHSDPDALGQSHPEFRILARKTPDPGRLKFNHKRHLKADEPVLGPGGKHYRLRCDDCHRAGDSTLPWRFGRAIPHQRPRSAATESEPHLQENYMGAISFTLHCSGCHALTVGMRVDQLRGNELAPVGGVPHTTPAAIQTYIRGELLAYVNNPDPPAAPPGAQPRTPLPKFAGETDKEIEHLKMEWVATELGRVERQMYGREGRSCRHCHELREPWPMDGESVVPVIVKPDIPKRWLTSASFSHEKHKALPGPPLSTGWANCAECHNDVFESTETSDVLLPGIENCRKCHSPHRIRDGVSVGGVSHSCVFCHTFHRPPAIEGVDSVAAGGGDS